MDDKKNAQVAFLRKWMSDAALQEQPWWKRWNELDTGIQRQRFYAAKQQIQNSPALRSAFSSSLHATNILAAAKMERERLTAEEAKAVAQKLPIETWAKLARARVQARLEGKINDMPLSAKDALVYSKLIDEALSKKETPYGG